MGRFEYAVHLEAQEGGFVVTCRDLPALITQGEDQADALVQAADAMDEVFAIYMDEGLPDADQSAQGRALGVASGRGGRKGGAALGDAVGQSLEGAAR